MEVNAEAAQRLRALRGRFSAALDASIGAATFEATPSGGLLAHVDPHAHAHPRTARLELPARADGAVTVTDETSGKSARFTLRGASRSAAAVADRGIVLYRAGAPAGGDIVHRAGPSGTEDFIAFDAAPPREAIAYDVDVSAFAGLRLVAGTLEMLDAGGVPLLRVAPPYVIDAGGARRDATISVTGCAYDPSPRAPFGRPVVAPGAASCEVVVSWEGAGVRYPALVDPVWASTKDTLITARLRHTLTLLNPTDAASLVLVAGGFSTVGGAALKAAELYDPLSRRFTPTSPMAVARGAHSATLLTTVVTPLQFTPARPVLVAGGADSANTPLASLEVYDPGSGLFVTDPASMSAAPRFEHTGTLVADNVVLLAGGTTLPLNQPTNSAYEYAFSGFTGTPPSGVTSTLAATAGIMVSSRTAHTATRLGTGQVLITGGFVLAGGALQALQSGELYDPTTKTFGAIVPSAGGLANMSVQRGYHTATMLANGQVMLIGGLSKAPGGIYTNTVDFYADGAGGTMKGFVPQPTPITMATGRSNHAATRLTTGEVLVTGGFVTTGSSTSSVEIFSPATMKFAPFATLAPMLARGDHAAILVNSGDSIAAGKTVIVTGGASSATTGAGSLQSAQILLKVNGDACALAAECLSGFCADGVCCDTACDKDCFSCTSALKQDGSADGACGATKVGEILPVYCFYDALNDDNVEVHNECDGAGHAQPTAGTHSCKPGVCGSSQLCSTFCDDGAIACATSGWCDFTQPPDGGAGDAGGMVGTCQPKKPDSSLCNADVECASAFCVDGVCCHTLCNQQCQACDLEGTVGICTPVGSQVNPQDPHLGGLHPRVACNGVVNGVKTGCSGACQGNTMACTYPGATSTLQENDCKDSEGGPSKLTSYPCDANGSNGTSDTDCGQFLCADAHACKTTCDKDADCIQDAVCVAGADGAKVCVALTGPLCDGEHTLRMPKASGGSQECPDHYTCPALATACLTRCDSVADCVSPFVCNGDNKCVETLDAPAELPSCAVSQGVGDKRSPAGLCVAALALAALGARRRRRS